MTLTYLRLCRGGERPFVISVNVGFDLFEDYLKVK